MIAILFATILTLTPTAVAETGKSPPVVTQEGQTQHICIPLTGWIDLRQDLEHGWHLVERVPSGREVLVRGITDIAEKEGFVYGHCGQGWFITEEEVHQGLTPLRKVFPGKSEWQKELSRIGVDSTTQPIAEYVATMRAQGAVRVEHDPRKWLGVEPSTWGNILSLGGVLICFVAGYTRLGYGRLLGLALCGGVVAVVGDAIGSGSNPVRTVLSCVLAVPYGLLVSAIVRYVWRKIKSVQQWLRGTAE